MYKIKGEIKLDLKVCSDYVLDQIEKSKTSKRAGMAVFYGNIDLFIQDKLNSLSKVSTVHHVYIRDTLNQIKVLNAIRAKTGCKEIYMTELGVVFQTANSNEWVICALDSTVHSDISIEGEIDG